VFAYDSGAGEFRPLTDVSDGEPAARRSLDDALFGP
jgi:hypothetical protein